MKLLGTNQTITKTRIVQWDKASKIEKKIKKKKKKNNKRHKGSYAIEKRKTTKGKKVHMQLQ